MEGVRQLEEMGFSQVVLAREVTAEEIRAIRAATHMKLEVFVHGALCMSLSLIHILAWSLISKVMLCPVLSRMEKVPSSAVPRGISSKTSPSTHNTCLLYTSIGGYKK